MKLNTNQVTVEFLVGRNNFYQISSRQCKRSDRIVSVIMLKTLHNKKSLRGSCKNKKDMNSLSWAMRETPDQRWEVSPTYQYEFPLSYSHTHIQIAMQILYMLQNILKLHSTEHHTVLNKPSRQDDFRFSRRHIWAFQKGLGDLVK